MSRVWSEILTQLPDARLKLKATPFTDKSTRERYWHLFEAHGVDRGRIDIVGPSPFKDMLHEYGGIDIGLDPIPYNGSTTTY